MATSPPSASPIAAARLAKNFPNIPAPSNPTHVLYWMTTALRTLHNPSLTHAIHLANSLHLPLHVLHVLPLSDPDGNPVPHRHAHFHLQTLLPVSIALSSLRIPLHLPFFHTTPEDSLQTHLASAAALVTDRPYLTDARTRLEQLLETLRIPCHIVEPNVVVPVQLVSQKQEHAARTIRPKISALIPQYLVQPPELSPEHQHLPTPLDDTLSLVLDSEKDVPSLLDDWPDLDRDAPPVHPDLPAGQHVAEALVDTFVKDHLSVYADDRNEPALNHTSNLSHHLRVGAISPISIALAVKRAKSSNPRLRPSRESFLEELIVRRELSVNACFFNRNYASYDHIVPNFAQISLALHKTDSRKVLYSYQQLEAAVTGDPFWNAAQLQLIVTGNMHGYMRMYWAKQVIGWTDDPKQAFDFTLRLNNRWALDGPDPNSYVGVAWCYGLHDRGWTERPVWGKVRYMNEAGLKRKFNMNAYIAMVDALVSEHGLPPAIAAVRKKHKMRSLQSTLPTSSKPLKKRAKRS